MLPCLVTCKYPVADSLAHPEVLSILVGHNSSLTESLPSHVIYNIVGIPGYIVLGHQLPFCSFYSPYILNSPMNVYVLWVLEYMCQEVDH